MVAPKRMKAADRKQLILEAAIQEYGRSGMHEVSTEEIAARAGISQPYLFRLFGTKTELIAAAIAHQTERILTGFREAVDIRTPATSPLDAMAGRYLELVRDDPNSLRCQLHAWAAASDPAIGPAARDSYRKIWNLVRELSGEDSDAVRDFMAHGMLLTVLAALDLTEMYGTDHQETSCSNS